MAAWQAAFDIIPSGPFPADYRERLDAVASRFVSWNSNILAWGAQDSNCVEIYHESGQPTDGLLRIDLRDPDSVFIEVILRFLQASGFGLEDEQGRRVEPVPSEFALALGGSRAFRFVEDPELYLRRLQLGGLKDV